MSKQLVSNEMMFVVDLQSRSATKVPPVIMQLLQTQLEPTLYKTSGNQAETSLGYLTITLLSNRLN